MYGTAYWHYVECTLVRVHLYRALRTFVRSRLRLTCAEGSWQFYSCRGDPDVAVEGARRGSRIWLVLGGDLRRLAGLYESLARGENLCCTRVCDYDVLEIVT